MSDHSVRVLHEDELRAANTLFRGALHATPHNDEQWEREKAFYQPGRVLGAFSGDRLVGTAHSQDATVRVPGGADLPFAAVTGVAVRADHTRRGVLTSIMRTQLDDFAERGIATAGLYPSEGRIYGRFGYGAATGYRVATVLRSRATFRPEAPQGGEVRLVVPAGQSDDFTEVAKVYAGLARRPGMLARSSHWWAGAHARKARKPEELVSFAVHEGARGADGFATYTVSRQPGGEGTMHVTDLHYDNTEAFAGLMRFLLSVDLVDEIQLPGRPHDEPLELLFTDPRACTVTAAGDGLWLRLVDVKAALAARERDAEPLVLEVDDPVLATNSGRYLVTPDAVTRTEETPDVRLGVEALAMVFLGSWRPSALAEAGRIRVRDDHAAAQVDSLFRTRSAPWCGTFF